MDQYFVYIMTNGSRKLSTGVTNSLGRRVEAYKRKLVPGFAEENGIDRLVYYEATPDERSAIIREEQIKGWFKKRKVELIETFNPEWKDLSEEWLGERTPPGFLPLE